MRLSARGSGPDHCSGSWPCFRALVLHLGGPSRMSRFRRKSPDGVTRGDRTGNQSCPRAVRCRGLPQGQRRLSPGARYQSHFRRPAARVSVGRANAARVLQRPAQTPVSEILSCAVVGANPLRRNMTVAALIEKCTRDLTREPSSAVAQATECRGAAECDRDCEQPPAQCLAPSPSAVGLVRRSAGACERQEVCRWPQTPGGLSRARFEIVPTTAVVSGTLVWQPGSISAKVVDRSAPRVERSGKRCGGRNCLHLAAVACSLVVERDVRSLRRDHLRGREERSGARRVLASRCCGASALEFSPGHTSTDGVAVP